MVETNDLGDDERMNDIGEGSISRWGGEPFAPSRGATYRIHFNRRGASMLQNHSPKDGFQVGSVNGSWATTSRLESVEPLMWACANEGDKLSRCNSTDPKNDEDFMYVGYWYEEKTGLYHIDPSLYYREDEYMDAIADARSLNQKAIWSFIQNDEVAVAPTPLQHFKEATEAPSEGSEKPQTLEAYLRSIEGEISRLCMQDVNDDTAHQLAYQFACIYEKIHRGGLSE